MSASQPRLIFVLAGQSNMAGRGSLDEAAAVSPDPRVVVFSPAVDDKEVWHTATDPLHPDTNSRKAGVGPGMAFAHELLRLAPRIAPSIGLVPCAFGGSELARWEEGGDLFAAAVARVQRCLAEGEATDVIAGVLWHQGESDCCDAALATSHAARLARALEKLRAAMGCPAVPVVLGELGYFLDVADPRFVHAAAVNAGMVSRAAGDHYRSAITPADEGDLSPTPVITHADLACVSAHGLDHRGDRLHFNSAAAEELGRRYAHAWLQLARPAEPLCEAAPPPAPLCFPASGGGDEATPTEAAVVD